MEATFWGVRGSHPVPGPSTVRYGGQTSCVEVKSRNGGCLIVDAGTGMRALGRKLAAQRPPNSAQHYDIILSHVHWDHIQGLPFFEPAYLPDTTISMYALRAAADELQQVIGGITRHEFFPVPLEAVPANFAFHEVAPGRTLDIADFQLTPLQLNHPFGAIGYRIEADNTSLAYVCDTAPFDRVLHKQNFLGGIPTLTDADADALAKMKADLVAALHGTDTVIYDTHFLPEEYERFPHYGHSTPDHALELCANNDIKRVVLYHHAPSHTDDMMDDIQTTYRARGAELGLEVIVAVEGETVRMGRRRAPTDPGVGA